MTIKDDYLKGIDPVPYDRSTASGKEKPDPPIDIVKNLVDAVAPSPPPHIDVVLQTIDRSVPEANRATRRGEIYDLYVIEPLMVREVRAAALQAGIALKDKADVLTEMINAGEFGNFIGVLGKQVAVDPKILTNDILKELVNATERYRQDVNQRLGQDLTAEVTPLLHMPVTDILAQSIERQTEVGRLCQNYLAATIQDLDSKVLYQGGC